VLPSLLGLPLRWSQYLSWRCWSTLPAMRSKVSSHFCEHPCLHRAAGHRHALSRISRTI
jgi:hypothetical protein